MEVGQGLALETGVSHRFKVEKMNEEEVWRAVVGYEQFYRISNLGRVWSLDRERKNGRGTGTHVLDGRELKPRLHHTGYRIVGLTGDDGPQVFKTIHRLIAEAFIENPEGHPVVRHLNDKKTDNRIENLAWGNYVDNQRDSVRNGTNANGNVNKTHCIRGHLFSEENTYWFTQKNGGSGRACRECRSTRALAYYYKKKNEQGSRST